MGLVERVQIRRRAPVFFAFGIKRIVYPDIVEVPVGHGDGVFTWFHLRGRGMRGWILTRAALR